MNSILETLLNIPERGLAVFKCEATKEFYIIHSNNLSHELIKHIKLIKDKTHGCIRLIELFTSAENISLTFIEASHNSSEAEVNGMYSFYSGEYRNEGYTDLRGSYSAGKYKLVVVGDDDFRAIGRQGTFNKLAYVYAMSRRYAKTVLGVFYTMKEAREYADSIHPDKSTILIPKVHNNYLTNLYYEMKHTTHIRPVKFKRGRPEGSKTKKKAL